MLSMMQRWTHWWLHVYSRRDYDWIRCKPAYIVGQLGLLVCSWFDRMKQLETGHTAHAYHGFPEWIDHTKKPFPQQIGFCVFKIPLALDEQGMWKLGTQATCTLVTMGTNVVVSVLWENADIHVARSNPCHSKFFTELRKPKTKYSTLFFSRKLYSTRITISYADELHRYQSMTWYPKMKLSM